jgi:hypothetical protein
LFVRRRLDRDEDGCRSNVGGFFPDTRGSPAIQRFRTRPGAVGGFRVDRRNAPPPGCANPLHLRHLPRRLGQVGMGSQQSLGRGKRSIDTGSVARADRVPGVIDEVVNRNGHPSVDRDRCRPLVERIGER